MAGIYIHIPFCKQACHYCDFHFSINIDNIDIMVDAICSEIKLQKNYLGTEIIETIYLGGGTPSLLNYAQISKLLNTIHQHYKVISNPEISLEANPDDLNYSTLKEFLNAGVNRLSIGIQTFDDDKLLLMNRAHCSTQAIDAINWAHEVGINNISIDLIYGIYHENDSVLIKDLEIIQKFNIDHISAYCMTIEDKTVFGNWSRKGKLMIPTDDFHANQYNIMLEFLEENGFEQYEISNFAENEKYSKHNSAYWLGKKYLGIGPSAHSYDITSRQYNIKNNSKYVTSISKAEIPFEKEILSSKDQFNELLLTAFRTKWGVDLNQFNSFKNIFTDNTEKELNKMIEEKYIEQKNNRIMIAKSSRFVSDYIIDKLFIL